MVHTKKKKHTQKKKTWYSVYCLKTPVNRIHILLIFPPQWKTSKDTMKKHFLNNYVSTDREQACQNLCRC